MHLEPRPRKNGTVLILGAGASRAALVKDAPPVIRDFVKEGRTRKLVSDYSRLWHFLHRIGVRLSDLDMGRPDLEQLYSMLHIISTGLWFRDEQEFLRGVGREFWKVTPVSLLESFIAEVTDAPSLRALKKACAYHDILVESLRKGDTIISFNYDLIADSSVRKNRAWSEMGGYGFVCRNLMRGDKAMNGKDLQQFETPSDVLLLKPHGSLNWRVERSIKFPSSESKEETYLIPKIRRWESFHDRMLGPYNETSIWFGVTPLGEIRKHCYSSPLAVEMADFHDVLVSRVPADNRWMLNGVWSPLSMQKTLILPPTTYKLENSSLPSELTNVWANMRESLSIASRVICIGYSFRDDDLEFKTLFRLAIRNNQNRNLEIGIVNLPDEGRRIVSNLRKMLPGVTVEHIADSFAEYVT